MNYFIGFKRLKKPFDLLPAAAIYMGPVDLIFSMHWKYGSDRMSSKSEMILWSWLMGPPVGSSSLTSANEKLVMQANTMQMESWCSLM